MSINLCAIREDGTAFLGVDSEGVATDDGVCRPYAKLMALPHAVLTIRGSAALAPLLAAAAFIFPADFDALVEGLPTVLPAVAARVAAETRKHCVDPVIGERLGIVVAGYSEARKRVVAIDFEQWDPAAGFRARECENRMASPWFPEDGDLPYFDDQWSMMAVAERMVQQMRTRLPHMAAGGLFLICEVSRQRISIAHRGYLGAARERAPVVAAAA